MPYFKVLLTGQDFVLNLEGANHKGGFATTRWVKARTVEEAELKAVDLVRNDTSLQAILIDEEPNEPRVFVEEISHVSWLSYFMKKPGTGYTFF